MIKLPGAKLGLSLFVWLPLASGYEAASAQLLSFQDIRANIQGVWAVPFEENGQWVSDCDRYAISIWFEPGDHGFIYHSQRVSDDYGLEPVHKSRFSQAVGANGEGIPAALIKYENEERTTNDGRLVE